LWEPGVCLYGGWRAKEAKAKSEREERREKEAEPTLALPAPVEVQAPSTTKESYLQARRLIEEAQSLNNPTEWKRAYRSAEAALEEAIPSDSPYYYLIKAIIEGGLENWETMRDDLQYLRDSIDRDDPNIDELYRKAEELHDRGTKLEEISYIRSRRLREDRLDPRSNATTGVAI